MASPETASNNERREEIARIIWDAWVKPSDGGHWPTQAADAILALPPLPQQGEWFKHDGSAKSPVEGRNVEMRFRDGDSLEGFVIPGVDWSHADDDGDVMEYRVLDAAPPASQALAEPVGEAGSMPGTGGFTMAVFKASDVPIGTKVYIAPPVPAEAQARVNKEGDDA